MVSRNLNIVSRQNIEAVYTDYQINFLYFVGDHFYIFLNRGN